MAFHRRPFGAAALSGLVLAFTSDHRRSHAQFGGMPFMPCVRSRVGALGFAICPVLAG